jgi:catechol 2,3-dioxygenase-like lactoylglutathione lyase family enzyme
MAKRKKQPKVERVTGVGGVFFKARDPEGLAAWYGRRLGISAPEGHADFLWRERKNPRRKGRTVWSVFPADTDYLGPSAKGFMVNYRVANLERMLEQLRRDGVKVEKVEDYDYGRFAWITDPEGNRIELWEDKGK